MFPFMQMCISMCRAEDKLLTVVPQGQSVHFFVYLFYFETGSLCDLEINKQGRLSWPVNYRDSPVSATLTMGLKKKCHLAGFLKCKFWGSRLGSPASEAISLLMELSPQPSLASFTKYLLLSESPSISPPAIVGNTQTIVGNNVQLQPHCINLWTTVFPQMLRGHHPVWCYGQPQLPGKPIQLLTVLCCVLVTRC